MIYLTLSGGLGNQMFEYAYARAISEAFHDPQIVINTRWNSYFKIYAKMIGGNPEYQNYQLNLFELNPNVQEISAMKGWIKGLYEMTYGSIIRLGIYDPKITDDKYKKDTLNGKFKNFSTAFSYFEHSDECKKNKKSVLGWFQSEKYFSGIREVLLKEFQFKSLPSAKNQEKIDELKSCNSVCVHIRRGDMLNPHYAYFTKPSEVYYKRGIQYISNHTKKPVFYIFSNDHEDIEWIKENYDFGVPLKYVDLSNPGYEDMRLMYHCKHFVISKSSFSWWGSYMSQNPDKIVVAPDMEMEECWLKDQSRDDFYRSEMIKLPIK